MANRKRFNNNLDLEKERELIDALELLEIPF